MAIYRVVILLKYQILKKIVLLKKTKTYTYSLPARSHLNGQNCYFLKAKNSNDR
jgi:hypothetical protein